MSRLDSIATVEVTRAESDHSLPFEPLSPVRKIDISVSTILDLPRVSLELQLTYSVPLSPAFFSALELHR